MSEILPSFLYLGTVDDAHNTEDLRSHGIRYILCVARECVDVCPVGSSEVDSSITRVCVSVDDSADEDITQHFGPCFNVIEEARSSNASILVHCRKGVSRSPSIVLAYLIQYHHYTFSKGLRLLTSKRSIVSIRMSFLLAIEEFSYGIYGQSSADNVEDDERFFRTPTRPAVAFAPTTPLSCSPTPVPNLFTPTATERKISQQLCLSGEHTPPTSRQ
jgi:hypothetical protein